MRLLDLKIRDYSVNEETTHSIFEIYFIITVYKGLRFRARSLTIDAINIFFVYTRSVLRDIIARCDPARLIIVRLSSLRVRDMKEKKKKI